MASTFPGAPPIWHVLPLPSPSHPSNGGTVEFDELAPAYPSNWYPPGDPGRPARDALAVHPRLHGRSVDADRLEVLNDHVRERALAQIRRVEPPQFADTHFPAVVDGDPRTVVEDAQSSGHTRVSAATTQWVTLLATVDSTDDGPTAEKQQTTPRYRVKLRSDLPDMKSGIRE